MNPREKMCDNKVKFPTEMSAHFSIGRARALYDNCKDNAYMRVYRCPFCKKYHITKQRPEK